MVKVVIEGEPKEVREFLDSLSARGGAMDYTNLVPANKFFKNLKSISPPKKLITKYENERARLFGKKRMLFKRVLGMPLGQYVKAKLDNGFDKETIIARVITEMDAKKTKSKKRIKATVAKILWAIKNGKRY